MRALWLLVLLLLAGCGSTSSDPTGIGRGTDALKKSPCACGSTFYRHGQWVS
jgi:hypothetical protein